VLPETSSLRAAGDMREPNKGKPGPYQGTYLVLLLATVSLFNGLDAVALSLALPSIKSALHLTDIELGVLTGIAFFLFYSTAGIPLGLWADRGDRATIIALATAIRGIMVMLVAVTRSFGELLIVRAGAAIGEAGCLPAAFSLIADYFPREERPRAVAKYLLGTCLSVIIGYSCEGWLVSHVGWRYMFVCIGVPSLVIAPLAWRTLVETRRRRPRERSAAGWNQGVGSRPLRRAIRFLWESRTFRYILGMQCAGYFVAAGMVVWQPSFFARSYGMNVQQLGVYFAVVYGVGSIIGTYGGGYLATRYAGGNESLQLKTLALVNVGIGALWTGVYLAKSSTGSFILLFLAFVGGCLGNGSIFGTTQTVIPDRMRAISISVLFLFSNLLGGGVGPLAIGGLSDLLHPYLGPESLRYALLASCPGCLVISWFAWQAGKTVRADVEAVAQAHGATDLL
jgi:MFS family permease